MAFLFLIDNVAVRVTAIILAMITDSVDGYFARKYQGTTRFGAILDPAMDKFFVFFALIVFVLEQKLSFWQAGSMVSRDIALCAFGIYLVFSGYWQSYQFRAIKWGKISTALQFFVLIAHTLQIHLPWYTYFLFVLFGALALRELFHIKQHPALNR
ncbi:MAG: CDP-alcohol phosphatidyltransferase family protein [Rhabdochlamydiaceae bacterium]